MNCRLSVLGGVGLTLVLLSIPAALAETIHLEAELAGASEAAGISADAMGTAEATLDTGTMILEWEVTYSGLSGPAFAAHIHGPAVPGEDAGIQIGFNSPESPIIGSTELTGEQVEELLAGKYYVNVHTEAQRGGEIRGFLSVADEKM